MSGARRLGPAITGLLATTFAACSPPAQPRPLEERITSALERGAAALVARQGDDGAWRGETYSAFRDGLALTPLAMKPLAYLPVTASEHTDWSQGREFLAPFLHAGEFGAYPVYTAALTVAALARSTDAESTALRDICIATLREHQLTEQLGWLPEDVSYGGWGYSAQPLARPGDDAPAPMFEADLSSTLFAVGALRLAGATDDDPAVRAALVFVMRCQNYGSSDAVLDDGGFCFAPGVPVQNKAGVAGVDAAGRTRYRSYGSATVDGLRAMLRCGLPPDHPSVVAAADWIALRFDAEQNPGAFDDARVADRDGSYFYYAWSAAHAMRLLALSGGRDAEAWRSRARALAEAILERQRDDGAWASDFGAMMEDEPVVATALAMGALGCAYETIFGPMLPVAGATSAAAGVPLGDHGWDGRVVEGAGLENR